MGNEFKNLEITWKTNKRYVDIDSGEIISEELAKERYVIINTKKKSNVTRTTGTTGTNNAANGTREY